MAGQSKPFYEYAFAPMCKPSSGVAWFAVSFIRHTRHSAQADFLKAVSGNGHGWAALNRQGWRIVRVKITERAKDAQ
jgi:hypothetical protein